MRFRKAIHLAIIILLLCSGQALAIGEISIGLNGGFTRDPNHLEDEINQYNMTISEYGRANTGSSTGLIAVPFAPVFGINIRYIFNYFLFRLGAHYTSIMYPVGGKVQDASGKENDIIISTAQFTFPVSVCLILPLKDKTLFYLGGGLNYHSIYYRATQTNPSVTSAEFRAAGLSDNKRDKYSANFAGFHVILGAEVPIYSRITATAEWMHQEGRSYPIKNSGIDQNGTDTESPKRIINVRGDFLMFGVNYYVAF